MVKKPDDLKILAAAASSEGLIPVYVLPGDNLVVPSFSSPNHESPLQLIHVRSNKCPLGSCKEKKTKLHTLVAKERPVCLHTLLCHAVRDSAPSTSSKTKTFVPKIDRDLSVNYLVDKIRDRFPSMESIHSAKFLKKSRKYVEKLAQNPSRNEVISNNTPKVCEFCKESVLLDWPFKSKKSFLISMGHLVEIEIVLKVCSACKRVFYPGKYYFNKAKLL